MEIQKGNKKNQKVATRLSDFEYQRILKIIEKGIFFSQSDFFRQAIRKELEYQEKRILKEI